VEKKCNQSAQFFSFRTNIYNNNQICAGVHMGPILNHVKKAKTARCKTDIDGQADENSIL